tara:strand:- start:55 stop:246 length:192 start_codon:yes stop_codon:yes gene_type:complete
LDLEIILFHISPNNENLWSGSANQKEKVYPLILKEKGGNSFIRREATGKETTRITANESVHPM